ncbi:pyocin knob domain-containing protein, partial [Brenneria corticis]|uniref:pyocin knob domain-containing protein n=1 Tax=Brenneria corticis TaxID=2173106 RepID=UPI00143DE1DF
RANLGLRDIDTIRARGDIGTVNLNTLTGSSAGMWRQRITGNTSIGNNYPVTQAGLLLVLTSLANNSESCIQIYYPYVNNINFTRTYNGADWTAWSVQWSLANLVKQSSTTDSTDGAVLLNGAWGLGADILPSVDFANLSQRSGLYKGVTGWDKLPATVGNPSGIFMVRGKYESGARYTGAFFTAHGGVPSAMRFGAGWLRPDSSYTWVEARHNGNTTVDANGFIKTASPIVKLFSDGSFETNDEATGVTAEKIGIGEYRISGCLGFNADPAWGGAGGGIEIPTDINKQPLLWVDYEIEADGSIIIRTYHRTHTDAPEFARNNIVGVENGQPIDIPAGRWVDVRVQMPGSDSAVDESTSVATEAASAEVSADSSTAD